MHIAHKMLRSCPYSASSSVSLLRLLHRRICRDRSRPSQIIVTRHQVRGCLAFLCHGCRLTEHAEGPKNKLALSSSPYLQQHATNPVRNLHVNDTQHIHASLVEPALPPKGCLILFTCLYRSTGTLGARTLSRRLAGRRSPSSSLWATAHAIGTSQGLICILNSFLVARKSTKAMGRAVLACMQGPARAMPLAAWLPRH